MQLKGPLFAHPLPSSRGQRAICRNRVLARALASALGWTGGEVNNGRNPMGCLPRSKINRCRGTDRETLATHQGQLSDIFMAWDAHPKSRQQLIHSTENPVPKL